jgi:uncharacterized Zn finger protein
MAGPGQDRTPQGFYPPSRPRRVSGGITARSTRGAIGSSWWSRRFIDALEAIAAGSRLTRGRSYARQGQVLSLDLAAGRVRAQVQGSRVRPYTVQLKVAPFTELAWTKVEIALAEQAIYSARLLAGEMPDDIEQVFAAAGVPLFATRPGDLEMSCSCPDWEVPCKHLAATIYLLGERFDTDPFQILAWRGRNREALLTRLRALRGTEPVADDEPTADGPDHRGRTDTDPHLPVTGTALALTGADLPAGLDADAERFWFAPVPLGRRPTSPDVPADLLLRQLAPPTAQLGGPILTEHLHLAYQRFAEADERTPARN